MRLIPVLTALLVTLGLYAIVFERDALLAFARGEASAEAADPGAEDTAAPAAKPAGGKAVGVVVLRSQAQTIDSAVILRGQTEAVRQVEVRAETSAVVISEPLRKGAFVEAGDVLCELDPGTREAALAEAEARLAEAQAGVPDAEARLQRGRGAAGRGADQPQRRRQADRGRLCLRDPGRRQPGGGKLGRGRHRHRRVRARSHPRPASRARPPPSPPPSARSSG